MSIEAGVFMLALCSFLCGFACAVYIVQVKKEALTKGDKQ